MCNPYVPVNTKILKIFICPSNRGGRYASLLFTKSSTKCLELKKWLLLLCIKKNSTLNNHIQKRAPLVSFHPSYLNAATTDYLYIVDLKKNSSRIPPARLLSPEPGSIVRKHELTGT